MSEEYLVVEEIPTEEPIEELPQRVNPFCVISKNTFGEHNVRDIQCNSSWSANPYGEDYAIVPDSMVQYIMETKGFCDIELNEEGTEVVDFMPLDIPEIPETEPEPTIEERVSELELYSADLLYQVCLLQLGVTEEDL